MVGDRNPALLQIPFDIRPSVPYPSADLQVWDLLLSGSPLSQSFGRQPRQLGHLVWSEKFHATDGMSTKEAVLRPTSRHNNLVKQGRRCVKQTPWQVS